MQELKRNIINTVKDCVTDLLYYDRKEDEDLPVDAIEKAIIASIITEKEIIDIIFQELCLSVNEVRNAG